MTTLQDPTSDAATKTRKDRKKKDETQMSDDNKLCVTADQSNDDTMATKRKRTHETTTNSRESRRQEKARLDALVPKTDEHGIHHTKLQLRRMRKRVKRGLDPVETPREEQERRAREKEMQREEEAELADYILTSKHAKGAPGNDDDSDPDAQEQDDDSNANEQDDDSSIKQQQPTHTHQHAAQQQQPRSKKAKRSKPVPSDYTCLACSAQADHWIYDCPQKITMKGTNQVVKRIKGVHNPARKVFVSGLPFDMKHADVVQLFQACGPIAHCKLLKFNDGDTGNNNKGRCKGQAYVTFETDQASNQALRLSGTILNAGEARKQGDTSPRKELKLKVSKAVNRALTKKKNSATE
jgi:hypothetical protein